MPRLTVRWLAALVGSLAALAYLVASVDEATAGSAPTTTTAPAATSYDYDEAAPDALTASARILRSLIRLEDRSARTAPERSERLRYADFLAAKAGDDVLELAAKDSWGNPKTLADHFQRHGGDFGARSADEYAQQASGFLQRGIKGGAQVKVDSRGVIRVYDPKTDTFGAYNPNGTTRTFYKPDPRIHGYPTNQAYFDAQPGTAP